MEKRPRESFHKERCLAFVDKLWATDTLAMFHHPVSATEVPGYYEVIASPIDLSTIKANIENNKYTSDTDVQDDVALMISNALEFNEKGTEFYDLARRLRKAYLELARNSGLTVDADAAFIPAKKARDDETTLRKAETKYAEKLEDVLGDLQKEKEIPLEELRKRYNRTASSKIAGDISEGSVSGDESDSEADEEDESGSDEDTSSSDYEDEEDEEDGDSSSP